MRTAAILLAMTLAGLAAAATVTAGPRGAVAATASCSKASLPLVNEGRLTVGTDNPAYPPWFAGGTPKGSKWKINDPSTGKGFESAVAYAVAAQLGFTRGQVDWTYVPFIRSYAPGKKSFDFDINQISFTPARAKVVAFSASYYDVNQAIVVIKGTEIARVRSIAGLRDFKLGAQLGTTSYAYIQDRIKPSSKPSVFPSNAGAIQSLKNHQIDGLVVDLPTAFYVTAVQVDDGTILGQFPTAPGGEHFGMVMAKGSPLVGCVNKALAALKRKGTLKKIQQTWPAKATGAPVLK
jgi:polar amino acid transport system substrate-binding protein